MDDNKRLEEALELALKDIEKDKIGLLKEHTLHRVLKFYLSNNEQNHEIKICRMYADVVLDNHIYEIQTKSFNVMRNKLDVFLKDYEVTICYPMALNKTIYLTNDFGELVYIKKSPKHAITLVVFWELYKLKNYVLHPQFPRRINHIYEINSPNNFKELLLVYNLKEVFTSKDFARSTRLTIKKATTALNVLTYLNVVERIGKEKNSYLYKIV